VVLKLGHLGTYYQKYLDTFEMRCWVKLEKITWTDRVKDEAVLREVKVENNVLHTVKRRKANWIGHIVRGNGLVNPLLKER